MKIPLNPKPNLNIESGYQNETVKAAIGLVDKTRNIKGQRDQKNELIKQLFESGFTINNPSGTRQINSKMLNQAISDLASMMKPLDFMLMVVGGSKNAEMIISDAVRSILDSSGYDSTLRDKQGVFFNLLMYGDGFYGMGLNESKEELLDFTSLPNSNVYADPSATAIRGGAGKSAGQFLIVIPYTWAEVIQKYPEYEKKGGVGKIPKSTNALNEDTFRTENQSIQMDDTVEVGYFFDLPSQTFSIFGGEQCTIIKELSGKEYPFKKNGKAYIPVWQYMCMPSSEGFYNHGVGEIIYQLALISQRLINKGIIHADYNALPLDIVNIPQGKLTSFYKQMRTAEEMRLQNKKGWIPVEYDGVSNNQVSVSSLTTQSLVNEWQALHDSLTRELRRFGINIDGADRGQNPTATQIIAEEDARTGFGKQIMEYNASETQDTIECAIDAIKRYISKNNKTIVNIKTVVPTENGEVDVKGKVTLGMVAQELKNSKVFIDVDARSGNIEGELMRQARATRLIQTLPPGSKASFQVMRELAKYNGRDFKLADLGYQEQPAQAEAPQAQGVPADIPTNTPLSSTDRILVNPRSKTQEPVM